MEVSHSNNPLWDGIEQLRVQGIVYEHMGWLRIDEWNRGPLTALQTMYGKVVSDPKLIDWLVRVTGDRVVQVDAGTGYWAWMLQQAGKTVVAYAPKLRYETGLLKQSTKALTELTPFDRWTLLVVAPTDMTRVNAILDAYKGQTLVLITEYYGDVSLDRRLRTREWPSEAERKRVEARAKLDERLRQFWTHAGRMQGVCFSGHLFEAHLYQWGKRPGWDKETMLMPIVRTEGRDDAT